MAILTFEPVLVRTWRDVARRLSVSLLLGSFCLVWSFGCSQRIADFTGISTKNIYAKGVDVSALPKAKGIKGSDIRFLGINANIKDALDEALEKGDGNLMIDCAVYVWTAPFVGGYEVRGTVVNVPYEKDAMATQGVRLPRR